MQHHKFELGKEVEFLPAGSMRAMMQGPYEVVQLMPSDGAGFQYRIKSRVDGHERVAVERELLSHHGAKAKNNT